MRFVWHSHLDQNAASPPLRFKLQPLKPSFRNGALKKSRRIPQSAMTWVRVQVFKASDAKRNYFALKLFKHWIILNLSSLGRWCKQEDKTVMICGDKSYSQFEYSDFPLLLSVLDSTVRLKLNYRKNRRPNWDLRFNWASTRVVELKGLCLC